MDFPEQFLFAMAFLFAEEGGTNADPVDRGGLTRFGISSKSYPTLDIRNLTRDQALEIYYLDYWLKQKCQMFSLPVGVVLFDSSVNCGRAAAAKWLQQSINQDNTFLKVDGIVGSKTILAATGIETYRLAGRIVGYRIQLYADLIKRYPEQIRFIRGWNNRAGRLLHYI